MRKKLLIAAAALSGIILLLIIGAFLYIRSGRLDLLLQNQIVAGLKESRINATIGKTHLDLRGYKVTLEDIMLYSKDGTKPFGSIEKLAVTFSVVDYLAQRIKIKKVEVTAPEIWYEIDERGRSNLEALEAPEETVEEGPINFYEAEVHVTNGKVNFIDRKQDLSAQIADLTIDFKPSEQWSSGDKINHLLALASQQGEVTYQGRKIERVETTLQAVVTNKTANVNKLKLASDLGETIASGQVASFKPLKYDFNVSSDLKLDQVARVFAPDSQLNGNARLVNGKVSGTGGSYQLTGALEADRLSADGFTVASLRVETDVSGSGDEYKATGDLTTGAVIGKGVIINSIRFSDAAVQGKDADFDVSGSLNLGSLKSGKVTVSSLRGRLEADPDRVTLSQFTAAALGGSVAGRLSVAYGGGQSRVEAQFRGVDLDQAAALAAAKDVKVRGTANGTANLTFPGTNFDNLTGRINATFDASIAPREAEEEAPAKGEVSLIATGRGFTIEKAFVRSTSSEITATGTISRNQTASLSVNFKSEDMAEVQRVVEAFGFIPDDIKEQYQIAVTGKGEFTGRVEGRLSSPSITGRLELENVQAREDDLGAFTSDISYSPSLLRLENASVVQADGSRADFTLNAPLKEKDQIAIKATVKDFALPAILRAARPELADVVEGGVVNGTIDLTGLPGPRTINGTANIKLSSAEFNVPSTEEDEETKKVSIPQFDGNVTFQNSVLTVEDLTLVAGGSTITGKGTFNLDTYEYSVNAEGKQIDLAQLSEAVSDNVKLTGQVDLTVVGQGKWGDANDWSDLNLNATLQGDNVALNGRDLGDAKIVAYTRDGLLNIEATADVLDQPRTLAATVDLRDRKNYPVSANVEFEDADLGPYLGLISPDLSGISGRASGRIVIGGSLLNAEGDFSTEGIEAVATLTKLELGGALAEGRQYTVSNQGNIVITATPREISLNRVTFTGEGTSLTLEGVISREEAARSNLTINGELNLRLISSFTQIVYATGIAQVQARITGSLDSPKLLGTVNLNDVGLRVVDVPLQLARGSGQIRFNADQAIIENFTAATTGGGKLTLSGGAALAGLAPDRWHVQAEADQVGIEYPRDTQTVFDASLVLQGNRRYQLLSGNVDVRRAAYNRDIEIEDLVAGQGLFAADLFDVGPGGGGGTSPIGTVALDIQISADETLVVRNNLADAIGSAYVSLRGTLDNPVPSGRVLLSRGTLEFRNDRYELTRGLITLPPRRGADPIFDVQSEAEIGGYQITIGFSGPLQKLQTTLRSDPELPESDIVSLILTGSIASTDASTREAVAQTGLGLAQSLLSASLSSQLERGAQRLFGISRFSVDPLIVGRGSDPTARVTIGQRITRNLTITYSQNLSSGGSGLDRVVLVEYRISNRFSLVGFRNERGDLGFDVRVRKRF